VLSFIRISVDSARLTALCVAGLALALASTAQARVETLRWLHPSVSDVSGFRVHIGSAPRDYDRTIEAGMPAADADGIFSFDVEVADEATVYVAVSAYNSVGESVPSNEGVREPDVPPEEPPPPPPPVDPGDLVFSDGFEAVATGQAVPNWTDTRAWNSMVEDDSLFSITTLSGNQVLSTSSTQTDIHSHYVGSGSADWSQYELRGLMRVSSSAARLGITTYSRYTSEDVYYRLGSSWDTGEMGLFRHPIPSSDGTYTCGSPGTGVIPQPNIWYRFRVQVIPEASATTVLAKVWQEGTTEPAEWQDECSDVSPSRPSSGTIGVWSAAGGTKYWDDLEVIATSGDTDPEEPPTDPDEPTEPLGTPGRPELILP
jgi:hypothetical protein